MLADRSSTNMRFHRAAEFVCGHRILTWMHREVFIASISLLPNSGILFAFQFEIKRLC